MHLKDKFPLLLALLLAACNAPQTPMDNVKLDANLGELAMNAGSPEVALRLTGETLVTHPNNVDALTRRGQALTELGRLDEARETLHKAQTVDPHNPTVLLALGRVQLPVDPAAAAANFEEVLKKDLNNAVVLNNLGIARDLLGHHEEAETAFRAALAAHPEMLAARVNLALCMAIRGQAADAIAMLRPLATAPDAPRKVKEDYAAVLAMAGQRSEAEHILSASLAADQMTPALDQLASARVTPASTP